MVNEYKSDSKKVKEIFFNHRPNNERRFYMTRLRGPHKVCPDPNCHGGGTYKTDITKCSVCGAILAKKKNPNYSTAPAAAEPTFPIPELRDEEYYEERGNKMRIFRIIGEVLLIIAVIVLAIFALKGCQKTPDTSNASSTTSSTVPTLTPTPTIAAPTPTPTPTINTIVNGPLDTKEKLNMTLDQFGGLINYTDRFAIDGTILDESLFEGEIIVGNAFSIHDNGFISQKGNVAFYYIAPKGGSRIRITGFDGQFFVIKSNVMTLNQAIAAMRETLIRAHGATVDTIQFHELVRYGDPVK